MMQTAAPQLLFEQKDVIAYRWAADRRKTAVVAARIRVGPIATIGGDHRFGAAIRCGTFHATDLRGNGQNIGVGERCQFAAANSLAKVDRGQIGTQTGNLHCVGALAVMPDARFMSSLATSSYAT